MVSPRTDIAGKAKSKAVRRGFHVVSPLSETKLRFSLYWAMVSRDGKNPNQGAVIDKKPVIDAGTLVPHGIG